MPKLKRKKAYAEETIHSFSGLTDGPDACAFGSATVRNFCFCPDGRLEKRTGYSLKREFSAPVRATWQSVRTPFLGRFTLAGNEIFYDDNAGGFFSFGQVQSSTGRANFFLYRGYLYLADSSCIYFCNFTERRFLPVYGYTPLIGTHWDPATGTGNLYEPLNQLSPRIRVSYDCPSGTTQIRLPFAAVSVDAVFSGTQAVSYTFTSGSRTLSITSASSARTIEVAMTLPATRAPLRNSILTCSISYGFQKGNLECLLLGGGYEGFFAFSAANVTSEMLSASQQFYTDTDPLYFKSTGSLLLGDQDHPITAFVRHNNRIIAFGTAGAWSLSVSSDGETVEHYFLDSCPGCVARDGAIAIGEELLVLSPAGLCSLRADSTDKDHFAVTPLSQKIAKLLADFDLSQAILFFDNAKNRILLRDASENDDGLLYLYDRALGLWTAWDDVKASRLFPGDRGILFASENKLFQFDDTVFLDGGRAYTAYYQSGSISFGSPEEYKRALRFYCEVSGEDETLEVRVLTESGSAVDSMECEYGPFPTHFECRVPTGRFRNFSYKISFTGSKSAALHSVGYCCNL